MSEARFGDPKAVLVRGGLGPFIARGRVPSDKSISHRAALLGALAHGVTLVKNPLFSADVLATVGCVRALGATVERDGEDLRIVGLGPEPDLERIQTTGLRLDCEDSGTTARLLLGALAGRFGIVTLDGSPALRRRPMRRVAESLCTMGANIGGGTGDGLPLTVVGGPLVGRDHVLPVASAQWKSALLLAGLTAKGRTTVREPFRSRDHTERMLPIFGVPVADVGGAAGVEGGAVPRGTEIDVPADPSSAVFLAVAAILTGGSFVADELLVNPTRVGAFRVMSRMGVVIQEESTRPICGEPRARVTFRSPANGVSELIGTDVPADEFPSLLDEVPILAVLAAGACGTTRFFGIRELRTKESDRVESTTRMLQSFGVRVDVEEDVLAVHGGSLGERLIAADVDAGPDHRIAMSAAVLGLVATGVSRISSFDSVTQSFPGFASWFEDRMEAEKPDA